MQTSLLVTPNSYWWEFLSSFFTFSSHTPPSPPPIFFFFFIMCLTTYDIYKWVACHTCLSIFPIWELHLTAWSHAPSCSENRGTCHFVVSFLMTHVTFLFGQPDHRSCRFKPKTWATFAFFLSYYFSYSCCDPCFFPLVLVLLSSLHSCSPSNPFLLSLLPYSMAPNNTSRFTRWGSHSTHSKGPLGFLRVWILPRSTMSLNSSRGITGPWWSVL